MKVLFVTVFICTCLLNRSLAQSVPINHGALIVLNGVPYDHKDLGNINPNDIEDVYILNSIKAIELYGSVGKNGAVLITTKQYMINTVKRRLGFISKDYRDYVESNADNSHIRYILNGQVINRNQLGTAIILFKIPVAQIKEVSFAREANAEDSIKATVNIITKQ